MCPRTIAPLWARLRPRNPTMANATSWTKKNFKKEEVLARPPTMSENSVTCLLFLQLWKLCAFWFFPILPQPPLGWSAYFFTKDPFTPLPTQFENSYLHPNPFPPLLKWLDDLCVLLPPNSIYLWWFIDYSSRPTHIPTPSTKFPSSSLDCRFYRKSFGFFFIVRSLRRRGPSVCTTIILSFLTLHLKTNNMRFITSLFLTLSLGSCMYAHKRLFSVVFKPSPVTFLRAQRSVREEPDAFSARIFPSHHPQFFLFSFFSFANHPLFF